MRNLFKQRFSWLFTLAIAALVVVPFAAFADNVQNDVATNYPTGITLIAGNATSKAIVGFQVQNTPGNDGDGGCNIDSGESLTINIVTPTGVTATPSSLTFAACDTFKSTTIAASSTGVSGEVSVTLGTNTTGSGSYNLNPAKFNITVQQPQNTDTTAPVIAVHDDVTVEATSANGAIVNYTAPTTSDNVDGPGTATCAPASGSAFPLGNTTITCNATDAAGNHATATTFVVHVVDTTKPTLTLPDEVTAEATSAAGAAVSFSTSASDLVDSSVSVSCTPASGSTFPLGTTTVSCSATDDSGNTQTGTFPVIVQDTTKPALTLPDEVTAEATSAAGATVTFTTSASDLVDSSVSVSCTPASGSTFPLGTTTVSCSATDDSGNTQTGTFPVIVQDTTAPVIAAHADVTAEATSANGATVTYTAPATTDAVDGAGTATCTPASGSQFALGNTTVTCSAEDAAGNVATTTSFVVHVVDTTPPTITFASRTPAANGNGWNNTNVVVTWNCSDTASGVVAASVSTTLNTEGADQTATGTCEDNAGNTVSADVTGINIDKTAPSVTYQDASGTEGVNGWYTSAVTAHFSASDNLSGFNGNDNPYTIGVSTESAEGSAVTVNSSSVTDLAGNMGSGVDSAAFKIDLSDPTDIAFVGGPSNGGTYYYNMVPSAPTCTASDAISGIASCVVTGYSNAVGSHTLTATATDNAGRTATATRSYSVLAWTLKGFYQPVDMTPSNATLPTYNTVKNGSTVPLKFEVFAGSTELTNTSIISSLTKQVACSTGALEDSIEVTATGGTSLRYDTTAGQFVYNWQTPKTPGACYSVTLKTSDGSSLTAFFKLK